MLIIFKKIKGTPTNQNSENLSEDDSAMLKEILTLLREEKITFINKVKEVQEESNHELIAEYKARLYNHPSKVVSENTIVGFIFSLPNYILFNILKLVRVYIHCWNDYMAFIEEKPKY